MKVNITSFIMNSIKTTASRLESKYRLVYYVQEEAKQEAKKLEGTLSTGKQAALKAIKRLETNASELREETAVMRQEQHADHQAKMATLNGEVP